MRIGSLARRDDMVAGMAEFAEDCAAAPLVLTTCAGGIGAVLMTGSELATGSSSQPLVGETRGGA